MKKKGTFPVPTPRGRDGDGTPTPDCFPTGRSQGAEAGSAMRANSRRESGVKIALGTARASIRMAERTMVDGGMTPMASRRARARRPT